MMKLVALFAYVAVASAQFPKWEPRIVGGVPVQIDEFPYQISLQYYGSHMCGGSIVSSRFIVTAAHCTDGQSASSLNIRAGSTYHKNGGQSIKIARIHQHPEYNSNTMDNDISILELASDITDSTAKAITPTNTTPAAGDIGIVTGWGLLWENGPIPDQLQGVALPVIDHKQCEQAYYPAGSTIGSTMLCAGYLGEGGKDACQRDSGGPFVCNGELAGVVSWGKGCADARYPGVFADVAALRSFISEVTGV